MTKFRYFPLSYDVGGKPVLVVGDGAQALQKLRLLTRSAARLFLFARHPEADLAVYAAAHDVTIVARDPTDAELGEAALAFVATGSLAGDGAMADRVRAAGVPVNVVDRPTLSDFATPAIVDRAPISIAIATDGHAPVLAMKLRGAIEAMLAPQFGRLGDLAAEVRARALAVGRLPDAAARRGFWSRLFDGPAAEAALRGEHDRAVALAIDELDAARAAPSIGRVFLIGAGAGALEGAEDLLTLRAHRVLLSADVVVHDAALPEALLGLSRRDADRVKVSDAARCDQLLAGLVGQGKRVARLSAAAPSMDDAQRLRAAGVAVEIVPGAPEPIATPLRAAA